MKGFVFAAFLVSTLIVVGTSLFLFGEGEPLARAGQGVVGPATPAEDGAAPDGQVASSAGGTPNCGSSGCGNAAGRSCCAPSSGQQSAAERVESIRSYLTAYYSKAMGDGIEVEVRDLGCHQEAEVKQAGRVIKKLSISGNSITEIS